MNAQGKPNSTRSSRDRLVRPGKADSIKPRRFQGRELTTRLTAPGVIITPATAPARRNNATGQSGRNQPQCNEREKILTHERPLDVKSPLQMALKPTDAASIKPR